MEACYEDETNLYNGSPNSLVRGSLLFSQDIQLSPMPAQSFFLAFPKNSGHIRASKMAQWVKALTAKPDALSLVTRSHMWRD